MREKQADYIRRRDKILQMGGDAKIAKQHSKGKLTARERLDMLFDPGTFTEIGMFVEHRCANFGMDKKEIPADGVVTGFGKVNGRLTYAFAQDATSFGGSFGEMHSKKIVRIQKAAFNAGAPIVALEDGAGGRIQESMDTLPFNGVFYENVWASGRIPQIAAIMGACAGGSAYSPALMDVIISVDKTSKMFITGPKVITQVLGEKVDEKFFGSGLMHNSVSGVSHLLAANDADCINLIKLYLSYFPQNCKEQPPVYLCDQDPDAPIMELDEIIPENTQKPYDMHRVLSLIFDSKSILEIQPLWAKNLITAFARLNGHPVGIIANNPTCRAGTLDVDSSDKGCHFISLCDAFNIPLAYLCDAPGYMPGLGQENNGIIRHGAKMLFANAQSTVPKIRLTMRKLYGGSGSGMCDWGIGSDFTVSWVSGEEAVMGAAGAAATVFEKEIKEAADPVAMAREKTAEYERLFNNPYYKARRGYTDMVIEPHDTRKVLIQLFESYKNKEHHRPEKKHEIFPC